MATYPTIPTLAPRTTTETAREYGLRAFHFLVREGVVAAVLDDEAAEQALAASQLVVVAPDMSEAVREQLHAVRSDLMTTIARRLRESQIAASASAAAPSKPAPSGGRPARLQRPVPVVPPAGAAARPF